MKKNDNNKQFNCVDFKRKAQARIYDEIKGLSPKEEIAYFRQKAISGPFGKWWQNIKNKNRKKDTMAVAEDAKNYKKK